MKEKRQKRPKKQPQNFGYTLVFILSMAAIAAILFSMLVQDAPSGPPVHTPRFTPPVQGGETEEKNDAHAGEQKSLTVTEEQLAELLAAELPDNFPIKSAAVELKEGTIRLTGTGSKTAFLSWVEDQGIRLTASAESALIFLPDLLEFDAEFVSEGDPHSGLLRLSAGKLFLCGAELPETAMGELLPEAVSRAINEAILGSDRYFTAVRIKEDQMELWVSEKG